MTILLKLSADAPRWYADVGLDMAQRFASEYPDRKGVRDGVFFHVQRGSEFIGVYVWRTPTGTIKADIATANPVAVTAADP